MAADDSSKTLRTTRIAFGDRYSKPKLSYLPFSHAQTRRLSCALYNMSKHNEQHGKLMIVNNGLYNGGQWFVILFTAVIS